MAGTKYRRHYIPLQSNPEVFTQLIHNLGVSKSHRFVDVLSIEDPDLLVLVPRPVLALILVFPTSYVDEKQKNEEEEWFADNAGSGDREQVMWFKQSVNNACGLYGVLHAISIGDARAAICEPLLSLYLNTLLGSSRTSCPHSQISGQSIDSD